MKRKGSPRFHKVLDNLRNIHEQKSSDYGDTNDPLANVRRGAELIGVEHWKGCLVRIADKLQRIKKHCNGGELTNENLVDSLDDLASYAVIMRALYEETIGVEKKKF